MIKVFLVEDEVVIRQSIKKNIDWENEGFEFAGEARDGELAYPLIQQIKPDIIITDIRMPFLDGLELSRLVKKEMPWIKIIILSGYDEFEYAREAITIGVTDYLLKPITGSELLQAVLKVKEEIKEERLKIEKLKRIQLEIQQKQQLTRQNLFIDLVSKKSSSSELFSKGSKLNLDLSAQTYNIILLQLQILEQEVTSFSKEIEEVKQIIVKEIESNGGIAFDRMDDNIAFLIKGMDHDEISNKVKISIEQILYSVQNNPNIEYFAGIGVEVERLSELPKCYTEACKAFAYRYIIDKNKIIYSKELEGFHLLKDAGIDINNMNISKTDREIIETFLKSGIKSEIGTFLREYLMNLGENNIKSLMFRQYIAMNIYFSAANMLEEWGCDSKIISSKCGDISDLPKVLTSVEDTITYLELVLNSVIEIRDMISIKKYTVIIDTAKKYINENFANEEISLNVLANFTNVSSSHFSTIFSQESGQTFIEYLTEVRMNNAKELLRCTNMKSSEIGYAVGYKDPHYFSYLFKKTQNCNPKEFRLRGKD